MKKFLLICFAFISVIACKNNGDNNEISLEDNRSKSYDQNDGLITMKGGFLYDETQEAAIFEVDNGTIYGVVIDDNMLALQEKVAPYKTNAYTSIPVTIRVKRMKNTDANIGWESVIEVKDILKVEAPNLDKQDVIQISN